MSTESEFLRIKKLAAEEKANLLKMGWETREAVREYLESKYGREAQKPVYQQGKRNGHYLRLECACDTFCIQVRSSTKKGVTRFYVTDEVTNLEHFQLHKIDDGTVFYSNCDKTYKATSVLIHCIYLLSLLLIYYIIFRKTLRTISKCKCYLPRNQKVL